MIINRLKSGVINMKLENSDFFYYGDKIKFIDLDIDNIYRNEFTLNGLYFNQINGYHYLVDVTTNKVYDFSDWYGTDILVALKTILTTSYNNKRFVKLYPLSSKESKSILQEMGNGL